MQKIPPSSPDLNPIENVFHLVRTRLQREAREKNITHQSWDVFKQSVQYHIWSTSKEVIDKTIDSRPTRLHQIVKTIKRTENEILTVLFNLFWETLIQKGLIPIFKHSTLYRSISRSMYVQFVYGQKLKYTENNLSFSYLFLNLSGVFL